MKVTAKGSIKAMNLYRALLEENKPEETVRWKQVGEELGLHISQVSNYQRGKDVLRNVEIFAKMSSTTGVSMEEFILVAMEEKPLPSKLSYLEYVAEKRVRDARKKKMRVISGGRS